jgi:hypothetical protein
MSLAVLAVAAGMHAHAVRTTGPISVDGRLDEAAWTAAPKQSGFTQRFPKDGDKPTFDTEFAVLYDDEAIYVGVWANDPEPEHIRRLLVRRDLDSTADSIAIGIDSYHDRRTAYVFQLNAAGVQRDMLVFDDQGSDDSWDAVWTGDVAVTDRGWTAEFRIPLSQLRFSDDIGEWGFQIRRYVGRTAEESTWSPWPRSGPQIVSRFGVLDGVDHVTPGRRLELLPYATTGVDVEPIEAGDPLNDHVSGRANVGLDLKYGLGPAFTLSATINPDFGQVEADPSQVNLGPTELFFAEKRPFFLEGMDLFRLPIGNSDNTTEGAFYSRRIGAVPADPDMTYTYIRTPSATTIYGAAKLTGKTSSGWSVGLLDAVTGKETTTVVDAMGNRSEPLIAPLTNYAVARIKRDFRDGKTAVGASATAVDRALTGTPLEAVLHDQAYTGGAQLQHRWDDNAWLVDVHGVGSWVHGSPEAIAATQTANLHLYQRPDATDVHFDPTRRSLDGMALTWQAGRLGDTEHWRFGIGGDVRTPGLELNDAGFQIQSDRVLPYFWTEYHENTPSEHLLNWSVSGDVFTLSNFEPTLEAYGFEYNANAQLASYWNVSAGGNLMKAQWDPVALRGGPALHVDPLSISYQSISTDNRKKYVLSLNTSQRHDFGSGGTAYGFDLGATIQARSNIDLYVGPSYSRRHDLMQYVAEADDPLGMPHYILSGIVQNTVSLTTRVNWTFSPHLSLQVYAQPFVATGRYYDLKDVDNPHASEFVDRFHIIASDYASYAGNLSFDKPDFDVRQLRSTVVLRWEYRPGSTVFAIWSHGQTSTSDVGLFRPWDDATSLVHASAQNLVMVKANYWIGL